jgi:hypothetical protein
MTMRNTRRSRTPLLLAAAGAFALYAGVSAFAQETHRHEGGDDQGCDAYEADVGMDLALLGGDRAELTAGDAPGGMPEMQVAEGYRVTLVPQQDMTFPVDPTRHMLAEGAFAGLMAFEVPVAGSYRISLSDDSWVDVVADGEALESTDFSGRHACADLRKWVSYDLEPGRTYTLMLSGGTQPVLGAAVVPADHPETE